MNNDDLALFQQAEYLANSGYVVAAYRLFCLIESHGNQEIEIKFWILQTTPSGDEAKRLLAWLEREVPDHPLMPRSRAYIERKWKRHVPLATVPALGPVMYCSYCGTQGPTIVRSKMSSAGVVVMVLLLIFTVVLFWIGLLIQEQYYVCNRCGAQLR